MLIDSARFKYRFAHLVDKYPFVGQFVSCDIQKGFGLIRAQSFSKEVFAHFKGCDCKQEKSENYQGKKCVFAYGANSRHIEKHAVAWLPEDIIEGDLSEYLSFRQEHLKNCSIQNIIDILDSEWYFEHWGNDSPRTLLQLDKSLVSRIKQEYQFPSDPINYIELSDSTKTPTYNTDGLFPTLLNNYYLDFINSQKIVTIRKVLDYLDDSNSNKLLEFLKKSRPIHEHSILDGQIANLDYQLPFTAKAIDIESDGENIFEFGFADTKTYDSSNIPNIAEEIIKFENNAKTHWIIGHNILDWDIPVIRKVIGKDELLCDNPIWDTLLFSWILEPWNSIHALKVDDNAHHAGEDAKAAYKLFEEQFNKLPSEVINRHRETPQKDIIEILLQAPDLLSDIGKRQFPNAAIAFHREQIAICPESKLRNLHWCPGVRYVWPKGYNNPLDYSFDLSKTIEYTPKNKFEQTAKLVIVHAAQNNIDVLVRMIPYWLREHISGMINECSKINVLNDIEDILQGNIAFVTSYKSYANSNKFPLLDEKRFHYESLSEGILEACYKKKHFSSNEIETNHFEGNAISKETLKSITSTENLRSLIDSYDERYSYWLHFSPCSRNTQQRPWTLWQIPKLIEIRYKAIKNKNEVVNTVL